MIQVGYGNNRVSVYKNGLCVWTKRCRNPKQMIQVYYEVMLTLLGGKQ